MNNFGISLLSVTPIRFEPNDRSEQVSQLLFGELVEIIKENEKWFQIKMLYDNYEGWMDKKQIEIINAKTKDKLLKQSSAFTFDRAQSLNAPNNKFPIVFGSTLHAYDGLSFKIKKESYQYSGAVIQNPEAKDWIEIIEKAAHKFLGCPYQWGGRSPFGIDCSGLTQVVFKIAGIPLPRDAWQQAEQGRAINFVSEAKTADLAFFDNDEGRITHVGIIIENHGIIHASGEVRLDKLDHYGIYNDESKSYSHKLRVLKRII